MISRSKPSWPRGETLEDAFDRFATVRGLTLKEDLARLADGAPQRWFSPRRRQLLADGMIEIVRGMDGLWQGDRITDAGRKALEA
jgi:hypothetical protein